jgi:prepilin signal peptidase PulO-like enzyme (type II secretory pathway)
MHTFFTHWPPNSASLLLGLWWFAVGACVGSFLNVVVYRLPAGLSIVSPGSHCPKCQRPIRWHDNLPIFGWIFLGGRCRDCHQTISARYPLVELLTAILFLLVGLASYPAWGLTLYYLLLLCTLWAAALIEYDGQTVPTRLMLPAAIVAIAFPLARPFLLRVAPGWIDVRGGWQATAILSLATAAIGLLFLCLGRRNRSQQRYTVSLLGWLMLLSLAWMLC